MLFDILNASSEPAKIVGRKVAGFMEDGLLRCDPPIEPGNFADPMKICADRPRRVELTEKGRTLLKYA